MQHDRPRVTRPWWVKFALLGLPNRSSAVLSIWLTVAIAAASVALGFRDIRFSLGALFVLPALWYLRAIRWVDRNGGWPTRSGAVEQ
jgi:hypothetical protein